MATLKQSSSIFSPKSARLYLMGYVSWKLGKIELASSSMEVGGRWRLTTSCGCRATVFDKVGSLLDRRLKSPSSSVDDVSKIKSCSCSTLRGFVGVCGLVEKAGSSLKWVIVGRSKSDDCSSSIPTSVSLDELECCAVWCSMNARPCWPCENKISEKDDSKLWRDCCCWLSNSSCWCCCCCNKKSSDGELKELWRVKGKGKIKSY